MRFVLLGLTLLLVAVVSAWAGYEMRAIGLSTELERWQRTIDEEHTAELNDLKREQSKLIVQQVKANGEVLVDQLKDILTFSAELFTSSDADVVRAAKERYVRNLILLGLSLEGWNKLGIDYDEEFVRDQLARIHVMDIPVPAGEEHMIPKVRESIVKRLESGLVHRGLQEK